MSAAEETESDDFTSEFELVSPRPSSKQFPDEEPVGRSGHSMVADESNLYVFGGYNPLGSSRELLLVLDEVSAVGPGQGQPTVLDELWKFNFAAEQWTKLETSMCPNTCASSCLVMRGPNLFVFGGTSYPFGQISGNKIHVCNLARPLPCSRTSSTSSTSQTQVDSNSEFAYQWDTLVDDQQSPGESHSETQLETENRENRPPKGYGQSLIFHDHFAYTFGGAVGFYNEAIRDMYRLDLTTRVWEKLDPSGELPDGRYKQEIVRDEHGFYIMGGGRLHRALPVHVLYYYNFEENTWAKVNTVADPINGNPRPRSAFGCAQVGSDVYINGGSVYGLNNGPHQVLQDMWHLSLRTLRWTQLPVSLPEPVYFHRLAVSPGGYMYMYGGVVTGGRRTTKLYRYRLPFQLTSLAELTWQRICGLWRGGMQNSDPSDLIQNYGIPRKLVHRLF